MSKYLVDSVHCYDVETLVSAAAARRAAVALALRRRGVSKCRCVPVRLAPTGRLLSLCGSPATGRAAGALSPCESQLDMVQLLVLCNRLAHYGCKCHDHDLL